MTPQPPWPRRARPPTLEDVAGRAGVSRALVSIVIRGAEGASAASREKVLQAAQELGYRPDRRARLLRRSRSRLLGVTFEVRQPFHTDLVEGIYAAAEPAGYDITLSAVAPSRDERRAVDTLLGDRCEALILLGPGAPVARLGELARRMPVVVVARPVRDPWVQVVRAADDEGAAQAVDHLVELGHERIVHIEGGRAPGAADRRRGYRAAMRRHGLARHIRLLAAGPSEESGARAAERLLAEPTLPTAALVFNDRCATGVLHTFLRAGVVVPTDISVVGYDDARLARLRHIDLTTVGQDASRMARLAVERAVAALEGRQDPTRETVITPHLVVRGTTAPVSHREPVRR